MINFNKKGISPVIATILLLAITVIIAVGVYQFLNSYTQDTYDNIQEDQTLSLQFGGKVTLYEVDGNSTMNIAAIDLEDSYNFTRAVFSSSSGNEECVFNTSAGSELQINSGSSESVDLGAECATPVSLTEGETYDVLMFGDSTIEVPGVRYR